MVHALLVLAGGALGSLCRYLTGLWTLRAFGPVYPVGTLAVNVVGSFLIGLISELILRRFGGAVELRLLLITGFLGGFTTFSAFSLDAVSLYERSSLTTALVYIMASVGLSLLALIAGLQIGRAIG